MVFAQDIQPDITFEKHRLVILPSKGGDNPESIESKLTRIVAAESSQLGRYEIIDRTQLKTILDEQALQMTGVINDSDVVEFGQIAGAKEGMVVNLGTFYQKGILPHRENNEKRGANFFDAVIAIAKLAAEKKEEEKYPNNIQTVIMFSISKIDIETGRLSDSYYFDVEHTGGTKGKSLKRALTEVRRKVSMKLRGMYTLTSQVLEVNKKEVTLFLGSDLGLTKGALFEISSLDRKKEFMGKEIAVPGRSVALVRIAEVSRDANRSFIVRKWGNIEKGFKAVEKTHFTPAGLIKFQSGSEQKDITLGFTGIFNPFHKLNFRTGLQLGGVKDSFGDFDFYLGFPLGLTYNLVHTPSFSFGGTISIPINIAFRNDDKNHSVKAFFTDPRVGFETTLMSAPHRDWVLNLDYVFSTSTGKWTWTETKDSEPVTHDAEWNLEHKGGPDIIPSGLYISAGIRFLYF